jgi:hypothetical protein
LLLSEFSINILVLFILTLLELLVILIGNKNRKLYRYTACIDPSDNSVTLPCNALEEDGCVEAVTTQYEDWERVTNYSENGDSRTSFVE